MLVTLWLEGGARETRDADFLGFGEADEETLKQIFAEIMAVPAKDGLVFDTDALIATAIRADMEYGGIRLRTSAYLERPRIPVVPYLGFRPEPRRVGQECGSTCRSRWWQAH